MTFCDIKKSGYFKFVTSHNIRTLDLYNKYKSFDKHNHRNLNLFDTLRKTAKSVNFSGQYLKFHQNPVHFRQNVPSRSAGG